MTETQQLLAAYAENGSETAFRELVSRHVNLVYATALRLAGGDAHRAQDVAQTVFVQLAQNAHQLSRESTLGGWLHRTTCNVASKVLRTERRRLERETQAMLMNAQSHEGEARMESVAPILDEAINQLGEEDRAAILLRFFEQRDFRSVGLAMGSNEDAARMRVNRALEKLQGMLKRKGVAFSTTALGTMLTAGAVSAAPAGLSVSIAGAAFTMAVAKGGGTTFGVLNLMSQFKAGIVGAILVTGLAGTLFVQHRSVARLQAENDALRKQTVLQQEEMDALKRGPVTTTAQFSDQDRTELLRLRGEMGLMRGQVAESNRRHEALKESYKLVANELGIEKLVQKEKEYLEQTMTNAKYFLVAFHMYATENNDRFPTAFEQTKAFLGGERGQEMLQKIINQFEFFPKPDLRDTNPTDLVILRGNAMQLSSGAWLKVYGFADGHVEALDSVNGDFTVAEAARKLVYPPRLE